MWPLSAVIFLLCCSGFWCHGCNLTKPYFQSSNFYNVLRWDDVEIPGQLDLYSVQYHIYGEAYKPVTWCQNISVSLCDLTNVTTDVESRYFAKITASGQCLGEVEFSPLKQTTLEAPQLSVLRNNTSLTVKVTPPMGPDNRPIEMISCWGTCKDLGTQSIKYKVHLTHPKSVAGMVFEGTSDSVVIWLVEMDTQYCGDVVYSLSLPFSSRQSEKASFCVTVSARQSWFLIFLFPGLMALLLLIIIPIVLYQQSVKRMCSLPKALILPKTNTLPLWDNSTWDDISKVQVWSGFSDICQKKLSQVSFAQERYKVIGYASQVSHDSAGSQQGTAGDGSEPSINYSMAVGCPDVQISDDPSTDDRTDETSSELSGLQSVWVEETNVPMDQELADSDINSKPLVVPVITGSNGALQLHEFFFQSSPLLALDSETLRGERTPLLTDLLIEGSRCNVAYLPVHVSNISDGLSLSFSRETSNYRENCLPGMPLERQQDQRTYILKTDHAQVSTVQEEEENIADGEESRVGLSFLDRWMLQMQG
ncbi:interferon lambda receptor 1 [Myxocyprinus asiaticus]|uniref:interferon lambda receptor 1 n=1 Tax=Myxocyprinus asiaticus TaxID=70543 RepID=UPI0022233EE9|nr:interferon lambda receptor 1 [Myxocyprinus asiaticus]